MREVGQGGESVGMGREIGTLFSVIAADFSDVITHSKKHFDQMFRLNAMEWV